MRIKAFVLIVLVQSTPYFLLLLFLLLLFLLLLLINVAKHESVQKCPDPELRAAAPYDMSNSLLYTHITPTHELRLR